MTIRAKMVQKIKMDLTAEERETLRKAYDIAQEFGLSVNTHEPATDIVSDCTGECFTYGELCRACGVLSALVYEDNKSWTVG